MVFMMLVQIFIWLCVAVVVVMAFALSFFVIFSASCAVDLVVKALGFNCFKVRRFQCANPWFETVCFTHAPPYKPRTITPHICSSTAAATTYRCTMPMSDPSQPNQGPIVVWGPLPMQMGQPDVNLHRLTAQLRRRHLRYVEMQGQHDVNLHRLTAMYIGTAGRFSSWGQAGVELAPPHNDGGDPDSDTGQEATDRHRGEVRRNGAGARTVQ
eukprot:1182854-Prorocentrum_minimum.AAC.3